MKKKIEFQLGAEKQIKVSKAGRSGSLFYEGYRQGLAGVIEIVRASTYYTQQCDCFSCRNGAEKGGYGTWCGLPGGHQKGSCGIRSCGEYYGAVKDKDYYNYPNNLIVFSGGRGTGKSSAMLTFVDSLAQRNSIMFQREFLSDVVKCELPGMVGESGTSSAVDLVHELLCRCTFLHLAPIDPTTLEEEGQILVNILARMFQKAEEVWEQNKYAPNRRNDLNEKNELMRQFTVCYEYASAIKQKGDKRKEFDGLDLLSSLGDSSNLKRQMAALVEKLLCFAVPEGGKDTYLVLQIDDTDMNVQQAYSILEDIRKYLVIPRLIIVMAADLEHLSRVVESSLLRSYTDRFSNPAAHVHGIASQYISKLVPQSRRICLPELGVYLREHPDTEIVYKVGETELLPDGGCFTDSQEQIFRLIYQKTGMVFLRKENHLHYIIPDNMRLLSHFLAMLVQMQTVASPNAGDPAFFCPAGGSREEHLARLQARLQNVQRFRDYFLGTWASNALTEEDAQHLRELAAANLPNKVGIVCSELKESKKSEYRTYSDMIRLLREKDKAAATDAEKRYYFAIRTYFSLLAHSIVLEELTAHYEKERAARYCVFKRLYPVFGSRIFPYAAASVKKRQTIHLNLKRTKLGAAESAAERKAMVRLLERHEVMGSGSFQILWKAPEKMSMPPSLLHKPQNPGFLYSMLCPYELPDGETNIWADFTTPIVNCLYLTPEEYTSPLSERVVADTANTSGMKPDTWCDMQSSALLVLLNWDVQYALGARVLGSVVEPVLQNGRDRGDMLLNLNNFYDFLAKTFEEDKRPPANSVDSTDELRELANKVGSDGNAADSTAENAGAERAEKPLPASRFAIACLGGMDLSVWLKPLLAGEPADAEPEVEQKARKDWEQTVNCFYLVCSEEEAAQEDGPGQRNNELPAQEAGEAPTQTDDEAPVEEAEEPPAAVEQDGGAE